MDRGRRARSGKALSCCLAMLVLVWLAGTSVASAATQTWNAYVYGGYQWVVPAGVTSATFDVSGASGAGAGRWPGVAGRPGISG
jgi:hypothetical protein